MVLNRNFKNVKKWEKSFKKFLKEMPTNAILCSLITSDFASISIKERVGQEVLKRNPDKNDLSIIIKYVESLRDQAWQEFLNQNPNEIELGWVVKNVESLREQAWQILLMQNPTITNLCLIIQKVEPLRKQAWQVLLKLNPNNDELGWVIENIESLKDQAGQKLLEKNEQDPNLLDLALIIHYVPTLRYKTLKLADDRGLLNELENIIG